MLLLLGTIVALTITTGAIHYWIGGTLLLLNAAGYFALAAMVVGSAAFYRPPLPLLLIALAGYASVTIIGWVVLGPYFDLAYVTKGIEVSLICAIALYLWLARGELRESIRWGRALLFRA